MTYEVVPKWKHTVAAGGKRPREKWSMGDILGGRGKPHACIRTTDDVIGESAAPAKGARCSKLPGWSTNDKKSDETTNRRSSLGETREKTAVCPCCVPVLCDYTRSWLCALERMRIRFRPVLVTPDFTQPLVVQTDASETGVGAVLSQLCDGEEHPIMFISRKLLPWEQKYVHNTVGIYSCSTHESVLLPPSCNIALF